MYKGHCNINTECLHRVGPSERARAIKMSKGQSQGTNLSFRFDTSVQVISLLKLSLKLQLFGK